MNLVRANSAISNTACPIRSQCAWGREDFPWKNKLHSEYFGRVLKCGVVERANLQLQRMKEQHQQGESNSLQGTKTWTIKQLEAPCSLETTQIVSLKFHLQIPQFLRRFKTSHSLQNSFTFHFFNNFFLVNCIAVFCFQNLGVKIRIWVQLGF